MATKSKKTAKISYANLNGIADCARAINLDPKAARAKKRRMGKSFPVQATTGYNAAQAKKVIEALQTDMRRS